MLLINASEASRKIKIELSLAKREEIFLEKFALFPQF